MSSLSRRQFIQDSILAGAAAAAVTAPAMSLFAADEAKPSTSPNEKIGIAVIGVRGRGQAHLNYFGQRSDVEVVAICDVDADVGQKRCDEFNKKNGYRPQFVQDMRRVFNNSQIHCVSIATPNHWHALASIWAMQAGKDVLVEKPVSHNISEGRRMVEAAEKHKRICQVGTQSRSTGGTQQTIEYIRAGKLGQVNVARGFCYKRRDSIGPAGNFAPPPKMDFDLWSGPAPIKPVTWSTKEYGPVHYNWHWFWDYGNGDIGNQGIHQMDIARWGLGVDRLPDSVISYGGRFGYVDAAETPNTLVSLFDYGPKTLVFETRGLPTDKYKKAAQGVAVLFEGTEGYATIGNYESGCAAYDLDGKLVKPFRGEGDHFGNFLKAVRTRKPDDIDAPILEGHLSSALCHMGNISYQLGQPMVNGAILNRLQAVKMNANAQETLDRTVEHLAANEVKVENAAVKFRCGELLKFDPKTESFIGNDKANEMCSRDYREPFVVPAAGKV
jgi:predicted dehydrogenase